MSTKIIPHIFGSILSLEKSVAFATDRNLELPSKDFPKILTEMKKLAQLIQLQFAKNDTENAIRSVRMFYGLLSMIRPMVIEVLQKETKTASTVRHRKSSSIASNLH
jgi:hypothetical protein